MLQEDEQIMRIGVLTGGGDCPGLNAVIRAVVRKGVASYGHEFVGFSDGWRGPLEGLSKPLGIADVLLVVDVGGVEPRHRRDGQELAEALDGRHATSLDGRSCRRAARRAPGGLRADTVGV